ncbi:hypothetical protein GCM10027348_00590 [Hymenobacter tenuis]
MLGILLLADTMEFGFSPVGIFLLLAGYFMPAIFGREQQNAGTILLLNLLLGWTIIGWFAALQLALKLSPADKEAVASFRCRRHWNNLIS